MAVTFATTLASKIASAIAAYFGTPTYVVAAAFTGIVGLAYKAMNNAQTNHKEKRGDTREIIGVKNAELEIRRRLHIQRSRISLGQ